MIEGIDHIALAVRSIDESLPYYTERLGLKLVHDEVLPSAGVRLAYIQCGPTMIQLVQPIAEGTPAGRFLEERGEGLHHLCFAVKDIPGTLAQLDGEGETKVVLGGRDRRACFLGERPNGLAIELTELEPLAEGDPLAQGKSGPAGVPEASANGAEEPASGQNPPTEEAGRTTKG